MDGQSNSIQWMDKVTAYNGWTKSQHTMDGQSHSIEWMDKVTAYNRWTKLQHRMDGHLLQGYLIDHYSNKSPSLLKRVNVGHEKELFFT
ncbi:serine/threonine-protein phosphatase with EF-hands 1 [Biomphalaria glabrata]|nr:serine/threonine-protein phosphatase with EF-hands 1 [Biomphalaria glabrata]